MGWCVVFKDKNKNVCKTTKDSMNITQDNETKSTVLTLKLDLFDRGFWMCEYGLSKSTRADLNPYSKYLTFKFLNHKKSISID